MQPTDRELIEGAAKAMGYDSEEYHEVFGVKIVAGSDDSPYTDYFNPLESKADAFDLMCALNLEPYNLTERLVGVLNFNTKQVIEEPITPTQAKEAATMRAITRAAYAVWKEKENG